MRGSKVLNWERKLKTVFDEIDHILEEEFVGALQIHPNRPLRGSTSNPEADGLFNVGASYTTGFGSESGEGYTVDIRLSSLTEAPEHLQKRVNDRVKELLTERLPEVFQNNKLHVSDFEFGLKIHGDISIKED